MKVRDLLLTLREIIRDEEVFIRIGEFGKEELFEVRREGGKVVLTAIGEDKQCDK